MTMEPFEACGAKLPQVFYWTLGAPLVLGCQERNRVALYRGVGKIEVSDSQPIENMTETQLYACDRAERPRHSLS